MPASPTVRQRRLRRMLRELRDNDGRPAKQVAALLGWSETRLTRLETTSQEPKRDAITALLDVYGITGEQRDAILTLVDEARLRGWWHEHQAPLPDAYRTYIGMEDEAVRIRTLETQYVPGLLQTEDYARAVIRGFMPDLTDQAVGELLDVRMRRQLRRLPAVGTPPGDGPEPLQRLWAIIDEAVLHRQVGGPSVLRDQLQWLLTAGEMPNVTIQVVPYTAGAYPAAGPFSILGFADLDPEVVYADTSTGQSMVEDEAEVRVFRHTFDDLKPVALPAHDTADMIRKLIKGIPDPED